MMNRHAKSPCCGAPVRRYGQRRRQCTRCPGTWRIRKKKRGRKRRPRRTPALTPVLTGRTTLRAVAERQGLNPATVQKRYQHLAEAVMMRECPVLPSGQCILLVDGLWTFFRGAGRYTLYLMALRNVGGHEASFLDPVLRAGQENLEDWRVAIQTIPAPAQTRICALVSDGLRGLKRLAEEREWVFQRCHFHLLAWLQQRRGQYLRRGKSLWVRDALLAYIRSAIEEPDVQRAQELRQDIQTLCRHPDCPRYLAMRGREFLRTMSDFRTYLRYPELHLPTTINTMETMIRLLRRLLYQIRGARTPTSFLRWTTTYMRLKRTLICNGKSTKLFP